MYEQEQTQVGWKVYSGGPISMCIVRCFVPLDVLVTHLGLIASQTTFVVLS